MSKEKKKKEKIIYVDDGRTIADMSGVGNKKKALSNYDNPHISGTRGTLKDQWQTYCAAVKMMFLPMLATIGGICAIFLLIYLVFALA